MIGRKEEDRLEAAQFIAENFGYRPPNIYTVSAAQPGAALQKEASALFACLRSDDGRKSHSVVLWKSTWWKSKRESFPAIAGELEMEINAIYISQVTGALI